MMKEKWKQSTIVSTLEVSNHGRVRNSVSNPPPSQEPGKIRYQSTHKKGYKYIHYKVEGKKKSVKVHRLVATEFLPNPQNLPEVNHKDGIKANNFYQNLEWCTRLHNMKHAYDNGLVPPLVGELNGRSVLNEDLVHKICSDYQKGLTPKDVIRKYNVTRNQAVKIKCKSTWKHITSQYRY